MIQKRSKDKITSLSCAAAHLDRRTVLASILSSSVAGTLANMQSAVAQTDPLPSWNDSQAKQ